MKNTRKKIVAKIWRIGDVYLQWSPMAERVIPFHIIEMSSSRKRLRML